MSVDNISGSTSIFEQMRAKFQAFRQGQTNLQKSDLESFKTALSSQSNATDKPSGRLDELLSNFSKIDTNGDGISANELKTAETSGVVSAPPPPPSGGPGVMGMQNGTQATALRHDLFSGLKEAISDLAASGTAATDALSSNSTPTDGSTSSAGTTNATTSGITKDDLQKLKDTLASLGTQDSSLMTGLDDLISKFSKIDSNGDGSVTGDELKNAADTGVISAPQAPEGGGGAHKMHRHHKKGGESQDQSQSTDNSPITKEDLQKLKDSLVANNSQNSQALSALDQMISNYDKIDTNGNGITADELNKAVDSGLLSSTSNQSNQASPTATSTASSDSTNAQALNSQSQDQVQAQFRTQTVSQSFAQQVLKAYGSQTQYASYQFGISSIFGEGVTA
ncbi:MAG: hypothetical protein HQM08_02230 [Candidatus Riflebacteria bacterium]|nr:hypothetical protein [Candidatus Riflebacteria bacterium]